MTFTVPTLALYFVIVALFLAVYVALCVLAIRGAVRVLDRQYDRAREAAS